MEMLHFKSGYDGYDFVPGEKFTNPGIFWFFSETHALLTRMRIFKRNSHTFDENRIPFEKNKPGENFYCTGGKILFEM